MSLFTTTECHSSHVQSLVGGHDVFDAFFKAYLQEHQFKTVTSEGFRAFFTKYFESNQAVKQVSKSVNLLHQHRSIERRGMRQALLL